MEAFIDVRVAPGRYRSAGEVIRAALRLPQENKRKRQNAEPLMEAGGAALAVRQGLSADFLTGGSASFAPPPQRTGSGANSP
jgi:putative addiction module CopG family antidote